MNLLKQLSVFVQLTSVFYLWAAEPPVYRIKLGSSLAKTMNITEDEFNALVNASSVLKDTHDMSGETTISLECPTSEKTVRMVNIVAHPVLKEFCEKHYRDVVYSPEGDSIAFVTFKGLINIVQANDLDTLLCYLIYLRRKELQLTPDELANIKSRAHIE